MDMAASDALHVGIARDQGREAVAIPAQIGVEVRHAGDEGRLVHEEQRRTIGRSCQDRFKPLRGGLIHQTMVMSRHGDVEPDDPHRACIFGHEMQRTRSGQVGMVREGPAKAFPFVMVARQDEERQGQMGEKLARPIVFGCEAPVHDIAGQDDDIGLRR